MTGRVPEEIKPYCMPLGLGVVALSVEHEGRLRGGIIREAANGPIAQAIVETLEDGTLVLSEELGPFEDIDDAVGGLAMWIRLGDEGDRVEAA